MALIGRQVTHKTLGVGTVMVQEGDYLTVAFQTGNVEFQFPKSFDGLLSINDPQLLQEIRALIEIGKAVEQIARLEREQIIEAKIRQPLQTGGHTQKAKPVSRKNVAFKCNYCDGGSSSQQVGFQGVCSDAMIQNNIMTERRIWCSAEECPCQQYLKGEISRKELDSLCDHDGFVCYESQMLRNWKAYAGIVQNGPKKDTPMRLNQVAANSLCVLTTRDTGTHEESRYIFAAFLVDETYEGGNREEGYVSTKSKYKIKLSPDQAHQMPFWKYHANPQKPGVAFWGSGLHRYFDDDQAALILRDIALLKQGTRDEELARSFFEDFCSITGAAPLAPAEANGFLQPDG